METNVSRFMRRASLWMNGWGLDVAERDAAEVFDQVAAGGIDERSSVAFQVAAAFLAVSSQVSLSRSSA